MQKNKHSIPPMIENTASLVVGGGVSSSCALFLDI